MSNPKFGYRKIKQEICAIFRETSGFMPRQKDIVILSILPNGTTFFHVGGIDYQYIPQLKKVNKGGLA